MINNKLQPNGILSKRLLVLEVFTFSEAIEFIKNLPYGRTADRANPNLVLEELRGTCSTKHALLKKLAVEQDLKEVKLFLCMFKMNEINTPKLAQVFQRNGIEFISEAHCVLKIENEYVDITNPKSLYSKIESDVLELTEIQPEQIGDFKLNYHKDYLRKWLQESNSQFTFEEFWNIREECIRVLSD